MKQGSNNSSSCTYVGVYVLNCACLVRAALNFLYIPLSVLPVVETEEPPSKRRTHNRENGISPAALYRSFTASKEIFERRRASESQALCLSDLDASKFILRVLYSYRDDLPKNAVKCVRRQAKFSRYIYTYLCSRGHCFCFCQ